MYNEEHVAGTSEVVVYSKEPPREESPKIHTAGSSETELEMPNTEQAVFFQEMAEN